MANNNQTILIVDDEETQLMLISHVVKKQGYTVLTAANGDAALDMLRAPNVAVDLMIVDLLMPKMNGVEVMKAAHQIRQQLPTIVLTAQGSLNSVIEAMRAGASDFIVKPSSPDRILRAIEDALETATIKKALPDPILPTNRDRAFGDIIGTSPTLKTAISAAKRAAVTKIPILLEGESGVGKEVFARAIHSGSNRNTKPFIAVNCGAIPANLVESILFGHEKGAFTGATDKQIGKFQEAEGGTLFLDEVGELPLDVQVKLLRALQEGEVDPVGASKSVKVDFRLISATNVDMIGVVRQGDFREDLYYRLNGFPIHLPALRERRSDIPMLAAHFLSEIASAENMPHPKGLSPDSVNLLSQFEWPGNVRQLQNILYRAAILCDGNTIQREHFPQLIQWNDGAGIRVQPTSAAETHPTSTAPPSTPSNSGPVFALIEGDNHIRSLAAMEKEVIATALRHYHGNMAEIARRLGVGRSTLYRKVKEYGLEG